MSSCLADLADQIFFVCAVICNLLYVNNLFKMFCIYVECTISGNI